MRKKTSKNERTYAVNLYEKWHEIEPWYNSNDDEAQRRLQYPANIMTAYSRWKRRIEHPDEPVVHIQRKRVLDLTSREAMLLSWRTLESLYGLGPASRFGVAGLEGRHFGVLLFV
jgi:hypothetical protein